MSERQQEINTTINFIRAICEEFKIALVAKEINGLNVVCVHDCKSNKDYVMVRNE